MSSSESPTPYAHDELDCETRGKIDFLLQCSGDALLRPIVWGLINLQFAAQSINTPASLIPSRNPISTWDWVAVVRLPLYKSSKVITESIDLLVDAVDLSIVPLERISELRTVSLKIKNWLVVLIMQTCPCSSMMAPNLQNDFMDLLHILIDAVYCYARSLKD